MATPTGPPPNIDALAKESLLFENAITPIPLTLPAHTSMLTGTIPPYHGVHDNDYYKVSPSNETIAEVLQRSGFATVSIISAFVLDSRFGLDQGFDSTFNYFYPILSHSGKSYKIKSAAQFTPPN